jgi:hypothetical protein
VGRLSIEPDAPRRRTFHPAIELRGQARHRIVPFLAWPDDHAAHSWKLSSPPSRGRRHTRLVIWITGDSVLRDRARRTLRPRVTRAGDLMPAAEKAADRVIQIKLPRPHERGRPHGRNAFSTSLFCRGGSKSTSATARVPRPRHRHSKLRLPVQAPRPAAPIHGASTQPHDTLTSRIDAASVVSVRTLGRTHRSKRLSNATVRILSDDPGSVEGLAATLRSRLAIGYPCGLTTATETSRLCPPRGRHWSVSMPRPAICTRSGGVSTTSPKPSLSTNSSSTLSR